MSERLSNPVLAAIGVLGSWHDTLIAPLSETFFQKALIGGSLVAIVCAVVGCFIILRRMAFLGDALAHAMLVGVAAGYLIMKLLFGREAHAPAMLVGSLIAAVLTVAMIGFVSSVSRIKEDSAIGIMYTGAFALGGFVVSLFSDEIHVDLVHFILGDVLAVSDADLWVTGIVTAVVLSAVILFFRHLQLTTFDPVMAASIGIPVLLIDYLLTTCTSLVVVSAVNMVGVVLVVGLMITPAASAYLLCDRLSRMLVVSALFAESAVVIGLYVSLLFNVSGGAPIVLVCTLEFLLVLVVAPRYGLVAGWLRRWRRVPQELLEKVLRAVLRGDDEGVEVSVVQTEIGGTDERLGHVLRSMERQDLVSREGDRLRLTESGQREARRILRAHRLWETYLAHVGLGPESVHERAERLQHLHDEASVDYLDDKLGHPLRDPHGSEIPEDFVHIVPGHKVSVSLLREGHRGVVTEPGLRTNGHDLKPGTRVAIGPRRDNDTLWTVILPSGEEVLLDHDAADHLTVQVQDVPDG